MALNLARWCRSHAFPGCTPEPLRPGKTWLRIWWHGEPDSVDVRLTAIGETSILVRRKGCIEFALHEVDRIEALRGKPEPVTIEASFRRLTLALSAAVEKE